MELITQRGPLRFVFDQDSEQTVSSVTLASWAGFRSENNEGQSDGSEILLVLEPTGADGSRAVSSVARHEGAVRWMLVNEIALKTAVLKHAFDFVQSLRADARIEDETLDDIDAVSDLNTVLGLSTIRVYPHVKDALPYLGFEFECDWDPEHGCGVLMHGLMPVDVGGAESAQAPDLITQHGGQTAGPPVKFDLPNAEPPAGNTSGSAGKSAGAIPRADGKAGLLEVNQKAALPSKDNPLLAYRQWLQSSHAYWKKQLLPGDPNPRKTSGLEGFDLAPECAEYFKQMGGQKSDKQFALPGDGGVGFALHTIKGCGESRANQLGMNYLMRSMDVALEHPCDEGVAAGKWRKMWYPIAQRALKWGWTVMFVDCEPLAGAPTGRVICQSIKWDADNRCHCLRTLVAPSIEVYFARLVHLAAEGRLHYQEKRGICLAPDDHEAYALLGMDRGHFEFGKAEYEQALRNGR